MKRKSKKEKAGGRSAETNRGTRKGYLSGKKREEIPEAARIIAVADTYDAMSFERIYRGSFDESHVTEEIRCGRGTQFDPKVADALLSILAEQSDAQKN